MKPPLQLENKRFGRLLVLRREPSALVGSFWACRCDCGEITIAKGANLTAGRKRSCGCLEAENRFTATLKHGHSIGRRRSITYRSWSSMITRCTNENIAQFRDYGGRGVSVCDRWRGSFSAFLEDMGERPSSRHSLDRYPDNNGNYEPGNCRWATMSEQCRNRRSVRPVVRSDGLRFPSIIDAAEATGGRHKSIRDACIGRQKTHRGYAWSFEDG